jgi:glutathione S-transferase
MALTATAVILGDHETDMRPSTPKRSDERLGTELVMAEMKLFWFPGTCSRVTLIALEEMRAPFTTTVVGWNWSKDPQYLALNPKGKVPTLVIDGVSFTETPAIITHLARSFPDACLLPERDPRREIDVAATMSWFASGMHPLITRLRFPTFSNDDSACLDRTREMAGEGLRACFALLEERLADRDWLYDDWSIMDGYLLWLWFRAVGSGMDGSLFPRCAAHAKRCERRASVARALEREEDEYARLLASGTLGVMLPPNQVGRAVAAV